MLKAAIKINLDVWLATRELEQWISTISREQFRKLFNESSASLFELISLVPEGMRKERLAIMYAHESGWFEQCKKVHEELDNNSPLNGKAVVIQETPVKANIGATKCWYIRDDGEPDYDYAGKNSIHPMPHRYW